MAAGVDMQRPTDQQIAMLAMVAGGLRAAGIAEALSFAPGTVENYLAEAKSVLGAKSIAHAVAIAIRERLIVFDCEGDPVPASQV